MRFSQSSRAESAEIVFFNGLPKDREIGRRFKRTLHAINHFAVAAAAFIMVKPDSLVAPVSQPRALRSNLRCGSRLAGRRPNAETRKAD